MESTNPACVLLGKGHKKRWFILALFCSLNLMNAALWVTYAPISDICQRYFSDSPTLDDVSGSATAVNMLAILYQILYAPGTFLGSYIMQRKGLRYTLLVAGILTAIGSLIKLIAALSRARNTNSNTGAITYALMFIGQCLPSMAQPMFVNFPAVIASLWFPENERDIAITIGSLFNPLGSAIGQVFPVVFVSVTADGEVEGMDVLMGVECALCILPLTAAYFFFDQSPSITTIISSYPTNIKTDELREDLISNNQIKVAEVNAGTEAGVIVDEDKSLWLNLKELMSNRDYVILLATFSIGIGVFNTIITLINQIVMAQGYSNDDAGTFGTALIIAGLVGASIAGVLMERTRAYRSLLKAGFGCCFGAMIFATCMLRPDNFILLLLAFSALGFFILPMLPLALENCAESTYPVPEDLSSGLLFIGGNVLGIGLIFAIQTLLALDNDTGTALSGPPFIPSSLFFIGTLGFSFILLLFYNGQYKRSELAALTSSNYSTHQHNSYRAAAQSDEET